MARHRQPFGRRAKQGVDDRVNDGVTVAVARETGRKRHLDTAEYQRPALNEPMDVRAYADTIVMFGIADHRTPFVLGTSVPLMRTAAASA